jgi:aspartate aminotransferase-like enzyme
VASCFAVSKKSVARRQLEKISAWLNATGAATTVDAVTAAGTAICIAATSEDIILLNDRS